MGQHYRLNIALNEAEPPFHDYHGSLDMVGEATERLLAFNTRTQKIEPIASGAFWDIQCRAQQNNGIASPLSRHVLSHLQSNAKPGESINDVLLSTVDPTNDDNTRKQLQHRLVDLGVMTSGDSLELNTGVYGVFDQSKLDAKGLHVIADIVRPGSEPDMRLEGRLYPGGSEAPVPNPDLPNAHKALFDELAYHNQVSSKTLKSVTQELHERGRIEPVGKHLGLLNEHDFEHYTNELMKGLGETLARTQEIQSIITGANEAEDNGLSVDLGDPLSVSIYRHDQNGNEIDALELIGSDADNFHGDVANARVTLSMPPHIMALYKSLDHLDEMEPAPSNDNPSMS